MNPIKIAGFKAYDLRGRIPDELNEDVAYRIGRAYAEFLKPKKVIVGRDIRLSSEELCQPCADRAGDLLVQLIGNAAAKIIGLEGGDRLQVLVPCRP